MLKALFSLLNIFAVKFYGGESHSLKKLVTTEIVVVEAEYWLAIGNAILILGLFMFTFVTMAGENPIHDRYGFRDWDRMYPLAAVISRY